MAIDAAGEIDEGALDRAFALAAAQASDGVAPFVILGVARADGVVRVEAYAGRRAGDVDRDAICLIASITKPIVATAAMQAVSEGRLGLTEPLTALIPELERPGRLPFSAWHVLAHTAGVDEPDLEALITAGEGRAGYLRHLYALPQVRMPGSAYRYTSATFDLVAEALERVDGVAHDEVIRRRVLEPLGMTCTSFDPRTDPALAPRAVRIPVGPWDGLPSAARLDLLDGFVALRLAGGGLWSTAGDLLRFGRAMLLGGELDGVRVLPPAFVELMTRETTVEGVGRGPEPLMSEHYGLGWGRPGAATVGSRGAFGHGGVTGTRLWIDPGHDLAIVYLTGSWAFPSAPIDAVVRAVYGALV